MPVKIIGITTSTPAAKAGMAAGMVLLSINGHEIYDGLDYEFYSTSAKLSVLVKTENGEEKTLLIKKEEYEPLGCEFGSYLIDKQHSCRNNCVFCFVDQLPKGLRKPLYFKDDDERLSFLFGNYITLTNLTQREVDRIIEMKISPINISVHTTNPKLRAEMMHNKNAGKVLNFIPMLAQAGISMNSQLVLCPGINDGDELRRSIEWLWAQHPAMQSLAAVPVGLSRFRQGLAKLSQYTPATAGAQLDIMLEYGDKFKEKSGMRFIYPSDEWFLTAGYPIPKEDFYDGYPQLENGVGMWRLTVEEFNEALEDAKTLVQSGDSSKTLCGEADIAVGVLAAPLYQMLAKKLNEFFPQAHLHVHTVLNNFFGHGITVTGLLTGQDISCQLKGKIKSKRLLILSAMLRSEADIMLDETTPNELAEALNIAVEVIAPSGGALLEAVLGKH